METISTIFTAVMVMEGIFHREKITRKLDWNKKETKSGVFQKTECAKLRTEPAQSADYPLRDVGHKHVRTKVYASVLHLNMISLRLA